MALAVFEHVANTTKTRHAFGVLDSCGTASYHTGDQPDSRTIKTCRGHEVPIDLKNTARGVRKNDFYDFDVIFGMDENNVRDLMKIRPSDAKAQIRLFGEVDDHASIADSWYTGDFEATYHQILRYSHAYLRELGLTSQ